jgi:hypothetical protein|nr:MAG TPA: hypothetical protein [Caudoviricetes sp.]
MTQFKGTPGPWKCLREEVNKHYIRISSTKVGERFAVANVLIPLYDDVHEREAKETRANAQLIAAAPELLEALQIICFFEDISSAQREIAEAAIAKATGETK